MARSRKRMLWMGILAGVVLITAFALGTHGYLRWRLNRYKAQLIANGEKLKIAELLPPMREHGSTETLLNAISQFSGAKHPKVYSYPIGMHMLAPGRAIVCGSLASFPNHEQETNTWEALGAELDALAPQMANLQAALETPARHFPVNYEQGFSALLPHLPWLRGAGMAMAASHLYELHRDRPEAALASLKTCLALAECAVDERRAESQGIRVRCGEIAMSATWETLRQNRWTDAQLADLQSRWQKMKFLSPIEQALNMERILLVKTFENWRESAPPSLNSGSGPAITLPGISADLYDWWEWGDKWWGKLKRAAAEKFRATVIRQTWNWYWSYQDEFAALKVMQVVLDGARTAQANPSWVMLDRKFATEIRHPNVFYYSWLDMTMCLNDARPWEGDRLFITECTLQQPDMLKMAFQAETMRELAVAAIALKRYQLRHGRPAPALSALAPEFVSEPPRDFMNGQPLQYRLNADGTWVLYSVGDKGQDDGGNATTKKGGWKYWLAGLDWVWPQPATAEEAETFFQAQAERQRRK